jgi:hypothetical protein
LNCYSLPIAHEKRLAGLAFPAINMQGGFQYIRFNNLLLRLMRRNISARKHMPVGNEIIFAANFNHKSGGWLQADTVFGVKVKFQR